MKKVLNLLAILVFTCACAVLTQAQATRTWVSGVGDDANPCSRTAPCKTFAGAISKTAACGEIDALDPGGFGAVTITKSITLDGGGSLAGILVGTGTAIIINANTDSDVVTLRNLSLNGVCTGSTGVNILAAKTVNIENCNIFRFTGDGVVSTDASGGLSLEIRETVIRDNGGEGLNVVASPASRANVTLDHVRFSGNLDGLRAKSGVVVSATNSVFSNNAFNGVFADNTVAGSFAVIRLQRSQITGNNVGVLAGSLAGASTSLVEISQNVITSHLSNGVLISTGGIVQTFQNNDIQGNGTNGCPGCTIAGPGQ